jgi:hypothetical protein
MDIHPSQRRISCELCRKNKAKCQRMQPEDPKCVRCTLTNVVCDSGQQRKVGRPKRKAPDLSSTAVDSLFVAKRGKQDVHEKPRTDVTKIFNDYETTFIQSLPGYSSVCEASTQLHLADHAASQRYTNLRSVMSTSVPDLEFPGWPSFMTDRWCHRVIPGAASGRTLTDPDFGLRRSASLPYTQVSPAREIPNRDAYDPPLAPLSPMDQAVIQGSLAWINPEFLIPPSMPSSYPSSKKKDPLPFGIGRPPAYYFHTNQFSSDPEDVVSGNTGSDGSGAMVRLISIVYGLRLRSTLVQSNRSRMNLSLLIHREGPLFIGNHSLAEYIMVATQELVHTIASLLNKPRSTQLSECLVATITDVYCRVLSFFELFLEHLTDRAERMGTDPVVPIVGLTFNGRVLTGACTQGTLFSSTVFYLLGRLENVIGLDSTSEGGLLSKDQIDTLCNKLDGSDDLAQSRGIMRPADVRKLYAQVSAVLEQLSLLE